MQELPIFVVDAFTGEPLRGNPAAVCLLAIAGEAAWMQQVAAEMNLSETAFVSPGADGFDLRWFSPTVEVDLCGHATLATAHVLWQTGRLATGATARFQTRSGLLSARQVEGWIELDFPSTPVEAAEPPDDLVDALGEQPLSVGRSAFDYLVEVASEDIVRGLRPDLRRIAAWPARGVIVTSLSSAAGVDFVSRFFGPASGIDEDPVTGSAHCALAPYWHTRLGRSSFVARQLSARGGELRVVFEGTRVRLRGQAVTVVRGALAVS